MILKDHHKRAARLMCLGMPPKEIAEVMVYYTSKQISSWRNDLTFRKYLYQLQKQYLKAVDTEIEQIRRTAIHRLQLALETSRQDSLTFQWAVEKALQLTTKKEQTLNINQKIDLSEPRAASNPVEKNALKELLVQSGGAERYMGGKVGEA